MSGERETPLSDPTAERTSDQSTQTAGGLAGGREDATRGTGKDRDPDPPHKGPAERRPDDEDPALPAGDATLKTTI